MSPTACSPDPVPASISRRAQELRVTRPHQHASVLVWLAWLDAKAELLEALASCAADAVLAADATRMARSLRSEMAALDRAGRYSYLSPTALLNTTLVEVSR